MYNSYIALGDSFTEGLGDPRPDGTLRGWADRVAEGLAHALPENSEQALQYANLAIRGRKLQPIIEEQVQPALAQQPDLVSFNAGGNDMLRPDFDIDQKMDQVFGAVDSLLGGAGRVVLLAGPDGSRNLPLGRVIAQRGALYTQVAKERIQDYERVTFVDNFNDETFHDSTFWSEDGLHLSSAGHLLVAANVLDALDLAYPEWWHDPREPEPDPKRYGSARYFKEYVAPWIGRRLTGRSSGDGRSAKRPLLTDFTVTSWPPEEPTWWHPPTDTEPTGGMHDRPQ